MASRSRLDRFISQQTDFNRSDVRRLIAQKRIVVNGELAASIQQIVDPFCHIMLDNRDLQVNTAVYLMLNKPAGVVSATKDHQHKTVIDLVEGRYTKPLHIVGRLDFNSTGMVLLTNDGAWSRGISSPQNKIEKIYRVTLAHPITAQYVSAFAEGMYFAYEGITTQPARLTVIDEYTAEVGLVEGRYHQIKRMFGRFQNKVLSLHRVAVGDVLLDTQLASGESRLLQKNELDALSVPFVCPY